MFYSQFILAKKGPLGTIWIAAHLERKLRKNQVADTDIGVSVDSILFPEVPIALRLSSHLLLGVVRIYSRKVNYLFDDCSEALLKIKQAFRSTAVDLPPEESTAPYHSITLPETFDLDDFELPDNDILQGNYVDHHISTREQITLQDTMEGVVYSTSQFGLDERFGDGDASQVGLDLEEDLFLNKVATPGLEGVSGADPEASDEPCPQNDASHNAGSSEAMAVNGTENEFEGLGGSNSEFIDYAQAPATPGLVQEPNVSSAHGLAYDDNLESEDHNLTELVGIESMENASTNLDLHHKDDAMDLSLGDQLNHDAVVCMQTEENDCRSGDMEINQAMLQGDLISTKVNREDVTTGALDGLNKVECMNNDLTCNNETVIPALDEINGSCQDSIGAGLFETDAVEISNNMDISHPNGEAVALNTTLPPEVPGVSERADIEALDCQRPEDCQTLDNHLDNEQITATCVGVLRACSSHVTHHDTSSHDVDNYVIPSNVRSDDVPCPLEASRIEEAHNAFGTSAKVQGEECHMINGMESVEDQITKPILNGETRADSRESDKQLCNAISSHDQSDNVNSSLTSDLPAPEKLLSVPERLLDEPDDLLVEATPDKEAHEDGDGSVLGTNISGKKRSFTESSLTVQSLTSVESFGVSKSKRTADFIPDDDDLLSSILIGRKSSVLKMKPTPQASEVASMKRSRSAYKPSALKRKVLMDDSMVLLGDTIRQQLTNTEDIRRLRKKAPCTRTEILMIQRQFLEGEIFSELVLTGMSAELASLHTETFDLSRIRISEDDENNTGMEIMKNEECSTQPIVTQDCEIERSTEPAMCCNGIEGQSADLPLPTEKQLDDNPADLSNPTEEQLRDNDHLGTYDTGIQGFVDIVAANMTDYRTVEHGSFSEMNEMGVDMDNAKFTDAGNHIIISMLGTPLTEPISGDICEVAPGSVIQSAFLDKTSDPDASLLIDSTQSIENAILFRDLANGDRLDGCEVLNHQAGEIVVGTESRLEETFPGDSKGCSLAEIKADGLEASIAPADNVGPSLVDVSSEAGIDRVSVNVGQAPENIENHNLGVDNVESVISGCDEKDRTLNDLGNEECKLVSTYSVGLDGDVKNAPFSDHDHPLCQEAHQQSTMDTEIMSLKSPEHHGDFQDVAMANDTEFLNVDDDEIGEDDDYGMPGAEDSSLLDNSGWSSRTRAVAKYLQNLFDKEAEHGRKVLSVDNLLIGKTRKEASRMFFETLVLKTKDYIHVEQTNPFDNINIKARAKLVKSDF